ncbi:uncharacterized protein CC84DRAFT_1201301 [Paraphaeosphaeria sporulosa]|uniref:Protein kinase domain-containing protein n=1 Tax=Paraphaeosphaeria sporulosa TaxID=1460663 RepID=A0A177CYW4_9PLEO|nr:uncharacterized protein CC84DRAFT_1201301 [Paraphaeosphaeria sporulosa]OAG12258.1 hypothetical protein CC84DRAFT_1201301 [Paraphaeosphaeria sporulosa]
MPGFLPPPSLKCFVHVRDLTDAGGGMSKGISVMLESSTSRPVTRKRVDPWLRKNYTTQEVASMRQLASHPNIVQLIEYMPANPWSGHGRAVPRALRGFPGPRYPATHATRAARVLRGAACCGTRGVRVAPRLGLLSAAALMHFGVRSADEQSAGNWASIYHRDLHSANVFLSPKGPRKIVGIPAS